MTDTQKLPEEQAQMPLNQEPQDESELSLDDLTEVSGSAATTKPRERGESRKSPGVGF